MKAKLSRASTLLNQPTPEPDKVIKLLHPLLKLQKKHWLVYYFLGIAQMQKSNFNKAIGYFERSLKINPENAQSYLLTAKCFYHLSDFQQAERYAKGAIQLDKELLDAWMFMGKVYWEQAELNKAIQCYTIANKLDPKNYTIAYNIAQIYGDQGDYAKALELYDITLQMAPKLVDAGVMKAKVQQSIGEFEDAEQTLMKVLEIDSESLLANSVLSLLYRAMGRYDEAIALNKKLLEQHPNEGNVRINYALCLVETGQYDEAELNYRRALKDTPETQQSLSNYLMGVHYNPKRTKEEIFEAHKLWDTYYAPKTRPNRPIPKDISKDKKLRVGMISGGFKKHPVGWMITSALEHLPKDEIELYLYTTESYHDVLTKRIRKTCVEWKSVVGYSDEIVADMIRQDEIDILVELSGHSSGNRLKTVALEPAPISIKWVGGLFNTSGLRSMDYLLTDAKESPKGEEAFYTEKLVRMPDDYICFTPPEYDITVGSLPAKENGYITFGCFNNPTKVNTELLSKWADLLLEVPNSRLFLKSKQYDTELVRKRVTDHLAKFGIEEDRIIFEGGSLHNILLETYNKVDIALDPWPYSGGLTTIEALWMGVPVVTKSGPTFAGRHSTSHLTNAGFPQWVTDNWEDYKKVAIELSSDLDKLAEIRAKLRQTLLDSPVCDAQQFAQNLTEAFRQMWIQRVEGYENDLPEGEWQGHIDVVTESTNTEEVIKSSTLQDALKQESEIESEFTHQRTTESETETQPFSNERKENESQYTPVPLQNGTSEKQKDKLESIKIETKDGVIICAPSSTEVLTTYVLLEQEEWYENELNFIRDYLKSGMNIIDVGAGFGVYSLPAAKLVGENGNVYAFEPDLSTKSHLERSKLENNFQNLEVIGKAVLDKAGKYSWEFSDTPELNKLSEEGKGTVATTTLDNWWQYEGTPTIDFIKIDVNGMERGVLEGASELLENQAPVILISIDNQNGNGISEILNKKGYKLYEYIPGPGILSEHDSNESMDSYMQNLVAVKIEKEAELKAKGWFFDPTMISEEVDSNLWKEELSKLPWTETLMNQWLKHSSSPQSAQYLMALNYLVASEKLVLNSSVDPIIRSRKAGKMLSAAQILIQLYNQGDNSTSVVFTLIRVLNGLGKRGQAVEVMQKLIENTKLGQENMTVELPFMLPIPEQDEAPIKTDLNKWLMVKTVESWILLKDYTTYLSGPQEQKLLEVLEGNPERADALSPPKESDYLYTGGQKELLQKASQNIFSEEWFQTLFNMMMSVRPLNVKNHDLPGNLIVSLTSYPKRFKTLHLTLASLLNQSIKPDRVILWIAEDDKKELPAEVEQLKNTGLEIRFTKDIKSYKKIIPTLKENPEAFIVTADDDVYYWQTWLEELTEAWKEAKNCVIAHRVHRARTNPDGTFKPYNQWNLNFTDDLSPNKLNFPTGIAGILYPPGVFHEDVLDEQSFMEMCPHGDDIWLYWMYRLNDVEVKITGTNRIPLNWPSTQDSALWKENLGNGRNDIQIQNIMEHYSIDTSTSSYEPPSFVKQVFNVKAENNAYNMVLPNWNEDHIQRIIAHTQLPYELNMLNDMRKRLSSNDLLIDIGANIGNHSIYLATQTGCKVIAFEPNSDLVDALNESIRINNLEDRVDVHKKGVGKQKNYARFQEENKSNIGAQRLICTGVESNIEITDLDSMLPFENLKMIKIDVEGMELDVLEGSLSVLKYYKPILYIEASTKDEFLRIYEVLRKFKYKYISTFNATPTHLFIAE